MINLIYILPFLLLVLAFYLRHVMKVSIVGRSLSEIPYTKVRVFGLLFSIIILIIPMSYWIAYIGGPPDPLIQVMEMTLFGIIALWAAISIIVIMFSKDENMLGYISWIIRAERGS